jgi:hypothetical protein
MLTPLEITQLKAQGLAVNLLSSLMLIELLEQNERVLGAVRKLGTSPQLPFEQHGIVRQLADELSTIEELFQAAGTFHENLGISA